MKALRISRVGDPDVLQLDSLPEPEPGAGQVRVRVAYAGINFADIMARKGMYPDAPPLPACMGYEFSGHVDAVGEGVEAFRPGQPVFGLSRFNAQAEKVVVNANQLFHVPDGLALPEAAAIPVNYLTAWVLLRVMGSLAPEDTVLIHNAGGGVGLAVIDIARQVGARMIGTASGRKHEFLRERGCHELVDYTRDDWFDRVMALTDHRGVELVLDPIGGAHLKKSYRALRATGRLGMFGISTASEGGAGRWLGMARMAIGMPFFHPVGLMNGNRAVFGVNMGHLWHEPEKVRRWMADLLTGVKEGWVRPHVDKVFTAEEGAEAHRYIESRMNRGKVLLDFS
ncbi:medium chain dehydrogenase/reductase family protein [Hahella sp. SMD15-11]|uniref:Medium chain dehydrogenase/reductase family protein n=1 Tax=Thermohahella caldifontis TaxID=3142973 RepID=A0AB39UW79_9GAMM